VSQRKPSRKLPRVVLSDWHASPSLLEFAMLVQAVRAALVGKTWCSSSARRLHPPPPLLAHTLSQRVLKTNLSICILWQVSAIPDEFLYMPLSHLNPELSGPRESVSLLQTMPTLLELEINVHAAHDRPVSLTHVFGRQVEGPSAHTGTNSIGHGNVRRRRSARDHGGPCYVIALVAFHYAGGAYAGGL
jgi:hypothetical protein